jgi:rhodanese-related sulfurtransferase
MHCSLWLKATALTAVVLTSGCSYVKGFYGGKTPAASVSAVSQSASATTPFLPQTQRHYAADISAARAYVGTQRPLQQRMTIVDVRDASEYRLGHPEGARHMPYPRVYQACEAHPFGVEQAQIRSDDGSQCRYGVVPGSEVRSSAADFFAAAQAALPYKDVAIAVLCRTGACAMDAANLLARPEAVLGGSYAGKGYTEVYVIQEGFVGEPIPARQSQTGRVTSLDKKGEKLDVAVAKATVYAVQPLAQDVNNDGKITQADYSGWRNFLGLPYVVSMHANLLSDAAQVHYDQP